MAAGLAEKAFREALTRSSRAAFWGSRSTAGNRAVQDVLAADGYVQQAYVIEMAKEAGFVLAGESEINANPKDTKDHPFGVGPARRAGRAGLDPAADPPVGPARRARPNPASIMPSTTRSARATA
jgi:hypothetical protein